jgi:hypothetical protein
MLAAWCEKRLEQMREDFGKELDKRHLPLELREEMLERVKEDCVTIRRRADAQKQGDAGAAAEDGGARPTGAQTPDKVKPMFFQAKRESEPPPGSQVMPSPPRAPTARPAVPKRVPVNDIGF